MPPIGHGDPLGSVSTALKQLFQRRLGRLRLVPGNISNHSIQLMLAAPFTTPWLPAFNKLGELVFNGSGIVLPP